MSLVGLDIGTASCKAIVFNNQGQVIAQRAKETQLLTPHPGWAEQDIESVWEATQDCLRSVIAEARADPPRALAVSTQGEAVVPVDALGRALRPAILGMDTRTTQQNEWLAQRIGPEALFSRTGMPLHTINTLPKLLWIKQHEPEIWSSVSRFLCYEDFFVRRFSGRAVISHSLASRTQMYDLSLGDWATDILETCGIPPSKLSALASQEGGVVGPIRPEIAEDLGISGAVMLVSGGHDQACAALGGGVIHPGLAMVSTGTAEVAEVAMGTHVLGDELRRGNISVYRHVVPGLFLAMTLNHSGGLLLRWFRDTLCRWEQQQAEVTGADAYDFILADCPQGPTNLLVLPHFSGSGTPWLDTHSKGAILGMTFDTTVPEIGKAILEGITFELRVNLELVRRAGINISELRALGGGARSPLWLQIKADICQVPLKVPRVTEAAGLGAALLAGIGVGVYPDIGSALDQTLDFRGEVVPDPGSVAAYDERFKLYQQVYPCLKPLQHRM